VSFSPRRPLIFSPSGGNVKNPDSTGFESMAAMRWMEYGNEYGECLMREIAADLWLLNGRPRRLFNVYLAGDVLIDTATRWARWRILRQLRGRTVRLVALTHCHPDHHGSARAICTALKLPLACHEADVAATEGREPMVPNNWTKRIELPLWSGPPHPVERVLRDGDEVAGFRVIHAPGHTPGHVVYFRDADRVAIIGDLLENIHFLPGWPGLRESPSCFSADLHENRRSVQKLLELRPSVICFGHGPPLRDLTRLERVIARWI
jgi:glyoxylase-like metal-dependent hydrolase (beta-lactamase superfamily II)